jgi:hypothetical protein
VILPIDRRGDHSCPRRLTAEYRTARLADCEGDELLMRLEDAADAEAMCLKPLGSG